MTLLLIGKKCYNKKNNCHIISYICDNTVEWRNLVDAPPCLGGEGSRSRDLSEAEPSEPSLVVRIHLLQHSGEVWWPVAAHNRILGGSIPSPATADS